MFLVRRNLTAHPLRSILTALAIALGVAMVLAGAIIGQAANERAAQVSGASGLRIDLEVSSRAGTPFDDDAQVTVRASPDVEFASPSLSINAQLSNLHLPTSNLQILGVDPAAYQALHKSDLADGVFLAEDNSIVLPMSVAIRNNLRTGDEITLTQGDRTITLTVSGRLKIEEGKAQVTQSQNAFVPLVVAQTLAGTPGLIDRVEVQLRAGADVNKVRAELAQKLSADLAVVRASAEGGAAFNTLFAQAGLAMVGVIILFAAGFVIMNAFAMSITARTKEIGALRTLGMTRGQITQTVLVEAGLLALVGGVAGVLAGLGLAWVILWAMGTLDETTFNVPGWAVVLSPLMGLTITLVSALPPAWRASHVSPMEAVKPEAGTRVGWYARHGGCVGAVALVLVVAGLSAFGFLVRPDFMVGIIALIVGMGALLAAMALLLPGLVAPVAALARPLLVRRLRAAGRLAADNIRRNALRSALTAGALAAGLTMVIATPGLITAMLKGGLQIFGDVIKEDRIVQFDSVAMIASGEASVDNLLQLFIEAPPLDPELVVRLEKLAADGVIELERMDVAPIPQAVAALPGYPGIFVDPEPFIRHDNFDFFEGDPETAIALMKRGRAMLMQPLAAERLGVHAGDTVRVQTPKGEVEFTVAGVGGIGWQMTAFPYADGEAYFGVGELPTLGVYVTPAHAARRDEVLRQIDEIVKDYPGNIAIDFSEGVKGFNVIIDQFTTLLNALLMMAVIVAALGVVNTMVINVAERKREIGMLRAVGATQRQVRQAVVAEAALLGLLAAVVAAVFSVLMLLAFVVIMTPNGTASLGFRPDWGMTLKVLPPALRDMGVASAFALVFGPLVAAGAAYFPARQAAAMDVMEATRSERLTLQPPTTRRIEGEPERALPRSLPLLLAQRALSQNQTRTILSILAVALGAAMTIAGDVVGGAIVNALSQAEDVRAVAEGVFGQIDPILKGIGAAITVAAGFLVFNTFLMSITQRRQQIGVLRSLGMTRGQVLRSVLTEALITGGVGVALGLIAGPLMGKGIIALIKSFDSPILGAFKERETSPLIFALALGLGLGITVLAALIPARQATRISPLVALRAEDLPGADRSPVRLGLTGFAILFLITTYLVLSPPARWIQPPLDLPFTLVFCVLWVVGIALALPAAIGGVARALAGVLTRLWGATGRLMADNLQRGRMRVVLTIASLAVGLTLIVAVSGFFQFYTREVFGPALLAARDAGGWTITTFGIQGGPAGFANRESLRIPREQVEKTRAFVGDRGAILESYFVIVPELSYFYDSYFSFVIDPRFARDSGTFYFQFAEGSWDTALPILDSGCGLLLTPGVARKNNAGLGDTITVKGKDGPVQCTIAGIGQTFVGATIIGSSAQDQFVSGDPFALLVTPAPGEDAAQLEADLQSFVERNGLQMLSLRELVRQQFQVLESVPLLFNGFLLLAILAAALGVVNTTLLSVTERRREFGQLRAVGATRAQVRAIVVGESALIGFIGGLVGMVAGVGFVLMLALVYGGNAMGVANYQPYSAAVSGLRPGVLTGLIGLLVSPLVCAIAAYLPANAILRGAAIETLNPEQPQPITRRQIAGLLNRGSLQTRFALGAAVLLAVVLGSLIVVVTSHARNYLESRSRDAVGAMVTWNASMVELSLPAGAETLTLANLQSGQFNAEGMLRFKALMDDLSANGLVDFSITDRDNVTLFSLDTRNIGTNVPPLDSTEKTVVRSERVEGEDTPHIVAAAPIENRAGDLVGSIRIRMRLDELRAFMNRLRNTLWTFGAAILVAGVAVSWALSRPFASATRQLAALAGRVARGDYSPIERPKGRRWPGANISIRTRLTIAMVLLVAVLVGVLGVAVIPLERRQVERTVRDGMLTAAEFIGQALSETFAEGMPSAESFNLQTALLTMSNLNLAKLREVSEQARSEDIAYIAVVNNEGTILLSDQITLVGESAPVSAETKVEEAEWKSEAIWVASTPLRRGREGEPIGTLRLGVRRVGVEQFLDESRNLFWLTGLIAVLAGVLLAQGIGGAVTAPVQELVTGAWRVARGDLAVRFRADTRDELAQLAGAYNEMVAGLRDRERVRDLFGRYVSREVSEAVLSGRVSLKGERKTITALYVDMRGSTAFAEAHPPEEVMGALNQYFEVVILATETYGGIVNRFVGDEAVCVFGAPTEQPDHAEQAVQAALAMRAGLAYLNQKRAALGLPTLRFGMGINTGDVVAGATGSEERQEYTVLGDAMNLGARIQDLNKTFPEHGILLSGFTLAALETSAEDYEFADLGEAEIRGKSQPVRVYGLAGRRGIQ